MKTVIICLFAFVVTIADATSAHAPEQTPTRRIPTSTTTSTTTLPVSVNPECARWLGMALNIGFTPDLLPMLERVMWRESRCLTHVHNPKDPNGGSYGLMQINGFWCRPSRYYPNGYLQTMGTLNNCKQLFEPQINLRAALVVYQYNNDWSQWGFRDTP